MTSSLRWRHLTLGLLALVLAGLAAAGCIGPAGGRERITSYDVTATIRADDTVAVREVIDWDFGRAARRGIFRLIPGDGGQPTDIDVSAPEAPDQFTVRSVGLETEIRVGDPSQQNRGRYRYEITYVLPRTIVGDRFALDAIGTRFDVPIDHARVTVVGAELADRGCFTGKSGSIDPCDLDDEEDRYVAEVDDLSAGEGVTVDGDVVSIRDAPDPEVPPFVDRSGNARLTWAGIVGGLAALVAVGMFVACRQLGRNQVAAGGATEAAFAGESGSIAFGPHPREAPVEAAPPPAEGTRMVADQRMGELAGLEFVPPRGVEPWQAAVVLRETIDDRTVGAWFAGLAAHDIVTMTRPDGKVVLAPGARATDADPSTAAALNQAFSGRQAVVLGRYDARFAAAWAQVGTTISVWAQSSGVFRRRPPQHRRGSSVVPILIAVIAGPILLINLAAFVPLGFLRTAPAAVILTVAVMGAAAWLAYRRLVRSLSAMGSGIALRAESFRRFLHASEAQHVEWAWQNGLLRDYSAWAVALGEAQAWSTAMATSSVPPVERASSTEVMSPSLFDAAFLTTRSEPAATASSSSSSGGSSGSSFSGGGSVGGGGGGGGGGSW